MVSIQVWVPRFLLSISVLLECWTAIAAQEITLSLDSAVKLALERNLELKAKREELGIAEGRLIRANLLLQHNPELEGDVSNRRLEKPSEGSNRNVPQGGFTFSQEFEIAGQPQHRREAANRNLEKVKLEITDFERSFRFRIAEVFLRLSNVREKITQAEYVVDLRGRLYEASKTRLDLGDIPGAQLIVAEFELNRSKSDLITLQRDYEELLSRLKSELVVESDEKVELVSSLPRQSFSLSLDELLKAVERRTD